MKRFYTFVEEVTNIRAQQRLEKLAAGHSFIPCKDIFTHAVDRKDVSFTAAQIRWPKPPKLLPIQPGILTALQRTVDTAKVKYFLSVPPNKWPKGDIPQVVRADRKFYLWDGHHRAAAAILLELRTITVEITYI